MKNLTKYILFILFVTFQFSILKSQVVYEQTNKSVYLFLERMADKGVITLDDLVLPLSREYIYEKLIEIDSFRLNFYDLNTVESDELEFYLKDYNLEKSLKNSKKISTKNEIQDSSITWNNFVKDSLGRYRLFNYESEQLKMNLDPILGITYGAKDGEAYKHWWNGAMVYGYLGNWLGFSFDFRDNHESGNSRDRLMEFSHRRGITPAKGYDNSFDYSEFNANLGVSWGWGSLVIGKGDLEWGFGFNGKLVLSNRAPSYPYIRFDVKPTNWLSFNYFHGWLASDVIDSTSSYTTLRENFNRTIFREKYIASHSIILTPYKGINFSFGESVIYSDKLEFLYLFPLSFFRAADHYLSKNNNDAGANSQFFFNLSSRNIIPNTHFWAEYLIDEITLDELGNPSTERTQHAFAFGFSNHDSFVENLSLKASYTKIYPFVYRHYIPTQTYESRGYLLGHWIGHNSDQIYSELNYTFIRGLKFNLWGEFIRKGEDGVVDDQYAVPQLPFLFGKNKHYFDWGISLKYEIIHDAFVSLEYESLLTSTEQENGAFEDNRSNEFFMSLNYGF